LSDKASAAAVPKSNWERASNTEACEQDLAGEHGRIIAENGFEIAR